MLKMLVAAGLGAGFGFTFLQNFLYTSLGGCLGVLLFYVLVNGFRNAPGSRWMRKRTLALGQRFCGLWRRSSPR